MKQQKSRREQFSQGAIAESLPSAAMNSSPLLRPEVNGEGSSIALDLDMYG